MYYSHMMNFFQPKCMLPCRIPVQVIYRVELLFLPMLSLQDRLQQSKYLKTRTSHTEQVFGTRLCNLLAHILCSQKKPKQPQPSRVSLAEVPLGAGVGGQLQPRLGALRAEPRGRAPLAPGSTKGRAAVALPGGPGTHSRGQGDSETFVTLGWEGLKAWGSLVWGPSLEGTSSGYFWATVP